MKQLAIIAGLMVGLAVQAAPKQDDYYKFTRIPLPQDVVLEAGGIAMLPTGKLAVSTRRGDIYTVSNPLGKPEDMKLQLYARGLHEPLPGHLPPLPTIQAEKERPKYKPIVPHTARSRP